VIAGGVVVEEKGGNKVGVNFVGDLDALPVQPVLSVAILVGGVQTVGIFDTGAEITSVSPKVVREGRAVVEKGPRRSLRGFFGSKGVVEKYATMELEVGELDCLVTMAMVDVPEGYGVVFGMDFISAVGLVIYGSTGQVRARNGKILREADLEVEDPPAVASKVWVAVEDKGEVEPTQESVKVKPMQESVKVKPTQESVKVKPTQESAKIKMKSYADMKRRPAHEYKKGDRVLVSRIALSSREDREIFQMTGRKLGPLFIGPYRIVEAGRNHCRLELPKSVQAHDTINVKYLKPYRADSGFGRSDEPPPVFFEGEVYFRPESLKKHRVLKVKGKQQHQYLVKFVGYTDSHNKWLSVDELNLCADMIRVFWEVRNEDPPRGAIPRKMSRLPEN